MPRKRRFFLPGLPVHVVQRGNNRQAVFFDENDYRVYLEWLSVAANAHGCAIHAVRAGMVDTPENYPWSSYRANALGSADPTLSAHPLYLALGLDATEREAAYRKLFEAHLDPTVIGSLRASLQTGTPLGNDRFRAQIEQALGVKVGYSTRGRPKKPSDETASAEGRMILDV